MTLAKYLSDTPMTETAFAQMLGVSQVTVHRYVKGERFPNRETILRIEELTSGKVRPSDWFEPVTPENFDATFPGVSPAGEAA